MKIKNTIYLLMLGCLMFMGCPYMHYFTYQYVAGDSIVEGEIPKLLKFNEFAYVEINCGFYNYFAGDKKRGVSVLVKMIKNEHVDLSEMKVNVRSSKLGIIKNDELPDVGYDDSFRYLFFNKEIEMKNERKILKLLENDTITIEFESGLEYQFVKT